ncbi:dTDP-4-dehydrorhamnose reductase [Bacteroidota bacterium]
MKILITGANGLLGQKLVKLFLANSGYNIIATSQNSARFDTNVDKLDFHQLDIIKPDDILELIQISRPDVIIHTAAITQVDDCELNPDNCWKVNVEGTRNMAMAARDIGAFLIHLSTDFVFDGENGPYCETDETNPISKYGESKLESESIVQSILERYAIVRTVLVYGYLSDMTRSNIVLWVKNSLEKGEEIRVVTDQLRTPTLAEDLAMGCKLIADLKETGIFHISGKDLLSPYDMAIQTARYFMLDEGLIRKANAGNFTQDAKRPPRTGFIIDKAKSILGYKPRSFEEGLGFTKKQMDHSQ